MRYPKEAVLFKVLNENCGKVPVGGIVEMCWFMTYENNLSLSTFRGRSAFNDAAEINTRADVDGGFYYGKSQLKPLTPAAVAFYEQWEGSY